VTDSERLALAALSRLGEPGDCELVSHVDGLGAEAVVAAIRDGSLASRRTSQYAARLAAVHPDADLAHAARIGARLVCPGDGEWPTQLEHLGDKRPLAVWVRGKADLRLAAVRSVWLVGSRAATAYGEHVAGDMSAALAERGWTVVSGAAYGVDSAAHRGALAVGGVTVAVLACGIDVPYPRAHAGLLARIAESGAVVTELPPGCSVTRPRFLERNRLIAALTRGTVVVEAALRSGARTTATQALQLNRHLMVVPGPVTSTTSAGCHEILRRHPEAQLVTDAAEVLDLVGVLGVDVAAPKRGEELPTDGLDLLTLRVLEALPKRRGRPVDAIVRTAGLDVATVLRSLSTLEDLALGERHGEGWRRAPEPSGSPSDRSSA
jgi:DNA processing protein